MLVLAIETSCDETSVAILRNKEILINLVLSQAIHEIYGGVVPEIASRSHMQALEALVKQALLETGISPEDLDLIAATGGPGLIGGVLVGTMVAKGMAYSLNKPLIFVNHLAAHALTIRLTSDITYPYLTLLISGGHCQFLTVTSPSNFKILGQTIDDALGECFDKVAKMMGLPYPGGPVIEVMALNGNSDRFIFPKPLLGLTKPDFSFSGLKTAVKRQIEKLESLDNQDRNDIASSFQKTILSVLQDRIARAFEIYRNEFPGDLKFVLSGGVAANQYIKKHITQFANSKGFELYVPPIKLCTDNAAMIGWCALELFEAGVRSDMDFEPKARWKLDNL